MKKSITSIFKEGIITNNPVFVQLLGMCPTLATTTSIKNAVGMGVAVIVVLAFSNLFISLLRRIIPKEVRIASYIVIISGFVTMVELLIKAFFMEIDAALGLFIPLIVVNCVILARAEAFASKNGPLESSCDGIATGMGFMLALICIAFVRELIGTGKLFAAADGTGGVQIFGDWFSPATIFLMPTGAFLTLGFIIALVQKIQLNASERNLKKQLENDAIEAGYHATLMKDAATGKIIRRRLTPDPVEQTSIEEISDDEFVQDSEYEVGADESVSKESE